MKPLSPLPAGKGVSAKRTRGTAIGKKLKSDLPSSGETQSSAAGKSLAGGVRVHLEEECATPPISRFIRIYLLKGRVCHNQTGKTKKGSSKGMKE